MPTTLGKYTLGRELGSGVSCKVKLAKDDSNQRYAIKILKPSADFDELVQTEIEALTALDHQNIIKLIEQGTGDQVHSKKGKKKVKYIVLEIAQGGELFDFVALGGALSESTARFFFGQLMNALKYCHDRGVVHRDLKPENIMLDKGYNVKVADFGFAAPAEGRDGSGLLETQLGTISYMAPEIHRGDKYDGKAVDIFAAAIILFVVLTQRPPFEVGRDDNVHY
jgi:serine/threonine protein kinase